MKAVFIFTLAVHFVGALAHPALEARNGGRGRGRGRGNSASATAAATATAATATAAAAAEGEGEGEGNEVNQSGAFGVPINLGGGDIKTDTLFPPGVNGALEVEFQNQQGRVLMVVENPNPAPPPAGFVAVEPVSYQISLAGGSQGLTLQKVDFVFNADFNTSLDISNGQIGRLSPETNSFVIGAAVGELEFEADENELTLTVDDMVGEWAVFAPVVTQTEAAATSSCPSLTDLLVQLLNQQNARLFA